MKFTIVKAPEPKLKAVHNPITNTLWVMGFGGGVTMIDDRGSFHQPGANLDKLLEESDEREPLYEGDTITINL